MPEVKVKVGADTNELNSGLKGAENSVKDFGKNVEKGAGGVGKFQNGLTSLGAHGQKAFSALSNSIGAVMGILAGFSILKGLSDDAGKVQDLSDRYGDQASSVQKVEAATIACGTSIDTVAKSMNKAELNATAAAEGNVEMQKAFDDLGVSVEDFMAMPMEERVAALADAYANSTNKTAALSNATKILGKGAGEMIPMLNQGGDALRAMFADASTNSTKAIADVDEITDRIGGAFKSLRVWGIEAMGGIIEGIEHMMNTLQAAMAFLETFATTRSLSGAKDAYNLALNSGLDAMDEKKRSQEEKTNKAKASNIAAIRAEAEQEAEDKVSGKAGEDAQKESDAAKKRMQEKQDKEALQDQVNAMNPSQRNDLLASKLSAVDQEKVIAAIEEALKFDAKKLSDEKKGKIDSATRDVDASKDALDSFKAKGSQQLNLGDLRAIGANLSFGARQAVDSKSHEQKQVDLLQKLYDTEKAVLAELKGTGSYDGITGDA